MKRLLLGMGLNREASLGVWPASVSTKFRFQRSEPKICAFRNTTYQTGALVDVEPPT